MKGRIGSGAGTVKDYHFGEKNNWRRRAWNYILENVGVPARGAIGIYLPTAADEDFEVAKSKGFRRENCIGVNSDKEVVEQLRSRGAICICADLIEVLAVWPLSVPVNFVLADFCCALSHQQAQLLRVCAATIQSGARHRQVLIVNQLRGREGVAGRAWMAGQKSHENNFFFAAANGEEIEVDQLHRGAPVANLYVEEIVRNNLAIAGLVERLLSVSQQKLIDGSKLSISDEAFFEVCNGYRDNWERKLHLQFHSYRSRGPNGAVNVMDSVFLRTPQLKVLADQRGGETLKDIWRSAEAGQGAKRKVAAALAARTKRLGEEGS